MSEDPDIQPVPVLSYETGGQSPTLKMLVRLVLWAEAANGLAVAITSSAEIMESRHDWRSQFAQIVVWGLQAAALTMVAVLCVCAARTGYGRALSIIGIAAAMLLDAGSFVLGFWTGGASADGTGFYIVESTGFFVQDCLLPLLVVVVLLREDTRPR